MHYNTIVTITGPGCSGKSFLADAMSREGHFIEAVSTTTRAPRDGEVDGVHYHFVSQEKFRQCIDNDEMVEHTKVAGQYYGLSKDELIRKPGAPDKILFVCDPVGVQNMGRYASKAGVNMVAAYLPVDGNVAYDRFIRRLVREPNRSLDTVRHYAKRIHQVFKEELRWGSVLNYTLVLPEAQGGESIDNSMDYIYAALYSAAPPSQDRFDLKESGCKGVDMSEQLIARNLCRCVAARSNPNGHETISAHIP